jgi:membrane protease YdiL (CAAX protease family)
MENLGKLKGYILSILLYSLAHAFTFNLSLMVAAIGAGAFWGFLFIWKRDLTPLIISHITWDVLLFTFGM